LETLGTPPTEAQRCFRLAPPLPNLKVQTCASHWSPYTYKFTLGQSRWLKAQTYSLLVYFIVFIYIQGGGSHIFTPPHSKGFTWCKNIAQKRENWGQWASAVGCRELWELEHSHGIE
jgi:hypothetical protein